MSTKSSSQGEQRGALLSPCGLYRYVLTRGWNLALPPLAIVGLNPSTADARQDDPTIRRCRNFAQRDGFGALIMLNVAAYRTSYPEELNDPVRGPADPFGRDNPRYLRERLAYVAAHGGRVVVAWGTGIERLPEDAAAPVLAAIARAGLTPECFGVTRAGHPKHPLYLSRQTPLVPYRSLR